MTENITNKFKNISVMEKHEELGVWSEKNYIVIEITQMWKTKKNIIAVQLKRYQQAQAYMIQLHDTNLYIWMDQAEAEKQPEW